jgi:hypothetical protein
MWRHLSAWQRMAVVAAAVVAALIGAVLVLAALTRRPHVAGRKVSEAEVRATFRARTGLRLARSAFNSSDGFDAFVPADETAAQERRYGSFAIYVVTTGLDAGASTLLDGGLPDARGVVWSRDMGQGIGFNELRRAHAAVATREYGANVFLVWHADQVGRTDLRWKRLDAILRLLAEPVVCRDCMVLAAEDLGQGEEPYRKGLATSRSRTAYDEGWTICDPTVGVYFRPKGESAAAARARIVAFAAGVYSGGHTDPAAIAGGVAHALARITNPSQQAPGAREVWRRGCLDALSARPSSAAP